jgi:LPS export ABC transporter protein LptC
MYTAARNGLGAAFLVGLTVLTWLYSRPQAPVDAPRQGAGNGDPSYYLSNATLFGTDVAGKIYYRLRAARVERPADGGDLQFRDLTVEYDPDTEVHWRLSAAAGTAADAHSLLYLSDGVRLESSDGQQPDTTVIEADTLTLDTAASTVTTPDEVRLAHGRTRFEATGLTADLASDRIDLHSNVSARLVP